jgi:hypothetical protein
MLGDRLLAAISKDLTSAMLTAAPSADFVQGDLHAIDCRDQSGNGLGAMLR